MGECLITRRGGEPYKLPTLDENYPEDLTVVDGINATFSVVFAEHGKPAQYTYKWYVNGEEVPNANTSIYNRDISSDKGEYTVFCEVTNKSGTVTSRAANLIVNKSPVLHGSYPANVSVDVTKSATFTVSVSDTGYPRSLTYQWYINNSAVSGATGTSYTISSAAKGTTSIYCKVSNGVTSTDSRIATLTANRLWLFNNGDQCENVTGGWEYNGTEDYAGVYGGLLHAHGGWPTSTKSKVNLAGYNYLYANRTRVENQGNCLFGVSESMTGDTNYIVSLNSASSDTGLASVNISTLNGSYYIKMSAFYSLFDISQFYLE